ncbi:MAG: hypothetical protein ACRYG8_27615 [Janthinobacterium lividum]
MFLGTDKSANATVHAYPVLDTLTEAHVTAITFGLESDWSIDRIVNCSEQLCLMLTPPTSPGLDVVFYIDMDERGLNLSLMQDDEIHACGSFRSVTTLMAVVRFIQVRNAAGEAPCRRSV